MNEKEKNSSKLSGRQILNEIWNWPFQWIESYYISAGLKFDIGIFVVYPEKVDTWQFQNMKFSHFKQALTCFTKTERARDILG